MILEVSLAAGAGTLGAGGYALATYNRLVRARNRLREAWSGVDVQLKRRHDLVPQLVAVVAAYRDHERELLEAVAAHRARAHHAADAREATAAESALTDDFGRLFALAEAYPQLKADRAFRDLAAQLVAVEDDLQYARRYYNGAARDLNNLTQGFPSLLVARAAAITTADYFEVENAGDRLPPSVAGLLGDRP